VTTAAQARAAKKRARQERERARRKRDRAELAKLREALKLAKQLRRERVREVVSTCRHMRGVAREHARAIRARYRALARAEIDAERQASRSTCEASKLEARAKAAPVIERALEALHAERSHQATLRRWAKRPGLKNTRSKRFDAISESDSEVEANLPSDMVPVWRKVKHKISATPRRTRTESFVEWVSEHAADVAKIQDEQLEREIAELVEREAELRERTGSMHYYRRASDEDLAAVPF
jgi:hypothetical protein